jgi:site-specific DNA-cytosine methylase
MNVFSCFDGMSCAQIALRQLGHENINYYASEVDKYAIKVTQANYPKTHQVGDITKIDPKKLPKIDLMVGGSPCQDLSFAGKGKGLIEGERSSLFFAFVDLLKAIKPKYFLVENVRMKKEYQDMISDILGVQPIKINSSLVSAQNRVRLYWTNIPNIKLPRDRGIVLSDILEEEVDSKYNAGKHLLEGYRGGDQLNPNYKSQANTIHRDKVATLSAGTHGYANGYVSGGAIRGRYKKDYSGETEQRLEIRDDGKTNSLTTVQKDNVVVGEGRTYRKLTPIECERLQTVPDNYTAHVSNTQRYKMLGNGMTVEVIKYILGNMEK